MSTELLKECVVSYRNSTSNHNPVADLSTKFVVVSYRNSTSNHNISAGGSSSNSLYLIEILHQTTTVHEPCFNEFRLYLIEILHQTTTIDFINARDRGCILSKFYIKPQRRPKQSSCCPGCILSKFYIKPQRKSVASRRSRCCILSKFYIKPQPRANHRRNGRGCILSKFYIKPQRSVFLLVLFLVVSYRNSTSNHNDLAWHIELKMLYLIEILHQTTTDALNRLAITELYLIEILHQTTTQCPLSASTLCCILSKFYIKPQLG